MDKVFKVHLINEAEDGGGHYRIGFDIEVEDKPFWYFLNIPKRYFKEVNSEYVLLNPEARSYIMKKLQDHSFAVVRYNAKYYPDKIKLL